MDQSLPTGNVLIAKGATKMTALNTLKLQLQHTLNTPSSDLSEGVREAVADAIYSCELGSWVALNNWINSWVEASDIYVADKDKEYQQGVRFVEQQWEAITGMF